MRRGILGVACLAVCIAGLTGTAHAAKYDADTVIVKYASALSSAQRAALFDSAGVTGTVGSVAGVGAKVVRVSGDPAVVAQRLDRSALVAYAEPNFILRATAVPNDPLFSQLYGLHNTGQTGGSNDADIDAPEGWDAAGLGAFPAAGGVKIGIVDTGIDQTHADLSGKTVDCGAAFGGTVMSGACADDNMHGTHVAGTIAAKANNATGVAGVAFNSTLSICKALYTAAGTGLTSDVANCINWTHTRGAKVISMSLGGGDSATLKAAVVNAWKGGAANGSVLVAAAGNDGDAHAELPGRLSRGGLRRGDRPQRRARVLLERERRRGDRGTGRERAVHHPGRPVREAVRHVDGHTARLRRDGRALAAVPRRHGRRHPQPAHVGGGRPRPGRP